jgi:cytochrome b6-f complex iron-sulfur subunit
MIESTRPTKKVDRRSFLLVTWLGSMAALVAQAGVGLFNFFKPRLQAGTFGTRVNAGALAEFKPGTVRHVPEGQFYISHVQDGLLAMWHRCTHLGCTVPWRDDEGIFHCPCHSSLFDPTGEVLGGPAPRPLDLFPLEIVDGEVVVDTSRVIQRQRYDPSQATKV